MLSLPSIIAVQGLGAHPYFTWVRKVEMGSQEREVMWLRDLLPSCVPSARIATFSYPSDWFTYREGVKTSLQALGEQLLNHLELDRQKILVGSTEDSIYGHLNQTYGL